MREYSHAFTRNSNSVAYSKYTEILHSGVVYYGMQERKFVKVIREQYGLNVVCTDFSVYNQRVTIYVYVDFEGNTCPIAGELQKILRTNGAYLPMDNFMDTASEPLKAFITDVADIFLDTLGHNRSLLDEVTLFIDDFVQESVSNLHGIALPDMRAYIRKTFGTDGIWRVIMEGFTHYEPSITIVADDPKVYEKLLRNKPQIEKKGYAVMKPHDHFNLLTQQDVRIRILLKENLDRDEVNLYAREIFGSLRWKNRP